MPRLEGLTKVSVEKFQGGRNAKQVAFAIPDDQFADWSNFRADEQALKFRPGARKVNTTQVSGTSPVRGLQRYYRMTGSAKWWLVGAGTSIYKVSDNGTITDYGLNLTRGQQINFANLRGKAYAVNGVVSPVRILGNTAVLLASEVITAPTGQPRIISNEVTIDLCNTMANWTAPADINCYSALAFATASPWEGTGNLKSTQNVKAGVYRTGLRKINLTLDLSKTNGISFYLRSSRSNAAVSFRCKDSGGYWSPYLNLTLGAADTWQRVTFPLAGILPANRDVITMFDIIAMVNLNETFEVDYIVEGDTLSATEDAWYLYAYYDETLAKYSQASPVSSMVRVDPARVNNLVQLWGSADTAADKFYLYRTQAGVTGVFYFVTAKNFLASTAVTVRDMVQDAQLGRVFERTAASGAQAPPEGASIIWQHNHRMFYVDPNDPSKVWMSNLRDAETCPDIEMSASGLQTIPETYWETVGGNFLVDPDNGQRIKAGVSAGYGVAVIGKDNSSYALYGDSMLNFEVRPISNKAGVGGARAMTFCETETIWVDLVNNTIWSWSPSTGLKDIGQPVSDLIKQIAVGSAESVCAIYHNRRCVISFPLNGQQQWLEYDLRTGTWTDDGGEIVRSGFTRHRGQDRGVMAVAAGPGDDGHLAFGDTSNGYLWKQTEGTVADGVTGISGILLFKSFDFKDAGREHRVRFVDIEAQGTSGTSAKTPRLQIGFFYDRVGALTATPQWTAGYTMSNAFVKKRFSVPSKVKGRRIQPWLKMTGSVPVAIHNYTMWVSRAR